MAPQRSEEEEAEQGFTVSDKRLFTSAGERKATDRPPETPQASPAPPRQEPRAETETPRPPRPEAEEAPRHEMPPADFSTFVAMLANNVMLFLGQFPDPTGQPPRHDLPQAKHTIDLLLMLREKTQGNLSPDEESLLQELLPQLQMAYVAASRQAGQLPL